MEKADRLKRPYDLDEQNQPLMVRRMTLVIPISWVDGFCRAMSIFEAKSSVLKSTLGGYDKTRAETMQAGPPLLRMQMRHGVRSLQMFG